VLGDRGLKEGKIEYQGRRDAAAQSINLADAVGELRSRLSGLGWRRD